MREKSENKIGVCIVCHQDIITVETYTGKVYWRHKKTHSIIPDGGEKDKRLEAGK